MSWIRYISRVSLEKSTENDEEIDEHREPPSWHLSKTTNTADQGQLAKVLFCSNILFEVVLTVIPHQVHPSARTPQLPDQMAHRAKGSTQTQHH